MRWKAGGISGWWRRSAKRRYDHIRDWHRVFVWRPLRVKDRSGMSGGAWVWLEHVDRVYMVHHSDPSWPDVFITFRSEFDYRLCETELERNERILRGEHAGDALLASVPYEGGKASLYSGAPVDVRILMDARRNSKSDAAFKRIQKGFGGPFY